VVTITRSPAVGLPPPAARSASLEIIVGLFVLLLAHARVETG
jgi:hypothetical protein